MTRSTFRVLFYANGSKEKNGIVPIMGRITINGTVAQFSCKRSIAKGNRAKGKSLEARAWDYKQYQRKNSKLCLGQTKTACYPQLVETSFYLCPNPTQTCLCDA